MKRQQSSHSPAVLALMGESEPMCLLRETVARVGETEATVLITGESGSGKELVARALRESSPRRSAPFVAINCAAIPSALFESEVFGHCEGAFTDAKHAREGLFHAGNGGTLFLDEIGEMPRSMQVKLLRVLQERRVRAVGGQAESEIDVRVVAATNSDLENAVATGKFREDLYYRLDVVRISTPPLRERGHDVLLLASYFMRRCAERMNKRVDHFSTEARRLLLAHDWPGNVRELENAVQRGVALARSDEVSAIDLGEFPMQKPRSFRGAVSAEVALPKASASHQSAESTQREPPSSRRVDMPSRDADPATGFHSPEVVALSRSSGLGPKVAPSLRQHLRDFLQLQLRERGTGTEAELPLLSDLQQIYMGLVIDACGGNKTRAARVLGVARRTLYRRLSLRRRPRP